MNENEKKQVLKDVLLNHHPILFLGAGFSRESKNDLGSIPMGTKLKQEIFENFIKGNVSSEEEKEIEDYNLQDVCQCVDTNLKKKKELREYLIRRFSNVEPQGFHMFLSKYPWEKIYTVNIDDLVEHIYSKNKIDIVVQNTGKQKNTKNKMQYIKLHGCVNEPDEPFVFSKTEYTNLISSRVNFKLNELVSDIQKKYFIFVGASLDEPDIEYYITKYENAGYFRGGKLYFIDPNPSVKLKGRVADLDGIIIEWTAEQFLRFIDEIKYNPDELQKQKVMLNYSGIFRCEDIINSISKETIYESRLYEGYNSNWKDIVDGWLFENPALGEIKGKIEKIKYIGFSSFCFSIYGDAFSGKDCILKQLGYYLYNSGYEVLEYRGKNLNINLLINYVKCCNQKKFVLLIENASYYYKIIEKLLHINLNEKTLLIITTSRNYNHIKKRYYLEGNPFEEYKIENKITLDYAKKIYDKLEEKGYLGDLSLSKEKGIPKIVKKNTLINLFTALTYGNGFKKRLSKTVKQILLSDEQIRKMYIELSIFDKVDLPYYPSELLTDKYTINFNIFSSNPKTLTDNQKIIVDFIRIDKEGIALKNTMLINSIWKELSKKEICQSILTILRDISPYVSEQDDNYWRIIFESLLKEDRLEKKFRIKVTDILELYYGVKEEYKTISYYWLQVGIAEQRKNDFAKAHNHLNMAKSIRPRSYQIQHAIARNYLRHACFENDITIAKALFDEGESHMKELINSKENYKNKARNFSIHCYVFEKLRFIRKKDFPITNDELIEIKYLIDRIINEKDINIDGLISNYIQLLKQKDKIGLLHMQPGDRYYQILNKKNDIVEDYDKLIESY